MGVARRADGQLAPPGHLHGRVPSFRLHMIATQCPSAGRRAEIQQLTRVHGLLAAHNQGGVPRRLVGVWVRHLAVKG